MKSECFQIVKSELAMHQLAAELLKQMNEGLVTLSGDLGVGKTSFVRGVLRALGYHGSVKSPSYGLLESYDLNDRRIIHGDLYRLESEDELDLIGFRDYFEAGALILLEWPEKAKNYLPQPILSIRITMGDESDERRVSWSASF